MGRFAFGDAENGNAWWSGDLGTLGHSFNQRDCRCPISIQRERENVENKVLFTAVSPLTYKRR